MKTVNQRITLTFVLTFMVVMLAVAIAPAFAAVTYGNGFKWTFWDPNNTDSSDWCDMIKGRTTPSDPAYWAPNPGGDAASISDMANAGKWSGTGSSSVWSVVGSANYPHMTASIDPSAMWLATPGYGWSVTGLWTVPDNSYGNSGLTKYGVPTGVGIGAPQFCERPYDMTPGSIVWLAFTAPVTADYNFICNAAAGIRFYKETDLVAGADFGVNSTTHLDAGQNLYLRVITAVDGSGWATADLYTVTATNVVVPEPSSMLALCCGMPVVLGSLIRRRKNSYTRRPM
ncbi:MAG: PEP-CTERM sorting domain-containing protein [Armatimonadota bacterium]